MMPALLSIALAGAAATAAGNGIARFAFVPIFPALVTAGWVTGAEAGILGATTLGGYLVGILGAATVARRLGVPRTLDLGMALVALSLLACAWGLGLWWLLPWRGLAGIAGGLLMALAGPATQGAVAPAHRGLAGGIVLAGVGLGIAIGALAVPPLLRAGLPATWAGLAALVLLLWAVARPRWPDPAPVTAPPGPAIVPGTPLLLVTYALHAGGMVPPMVYLGDLAARGLGLGVAAAALAWAVFGLVGIVGGILGGRVADRIGARPTLVLWLVVQVAALGLALLPAPAALWPAAALSGFAAIGVSTVTLAVTRELAPVHAAGLWVRATAAFAVAQTVVGFALAGLFAATEERHAPVFAVGFACSLAALAASVLLLRRRPMPGSARR